MPSNPRVVVITGASSGIGRATAYEFARDGAALVLAARREPVLDELVGECEGMGAQAVAVPTDVGVEQQVMDLAGEAVNRFGRIDAWVNNAAVTFLARLEKAPIDELRQLIDVNLLGYLYGARAALAQFRRQGNGVLVNVTSMVAEVPVPYIGGYVLSKAATRALGAVLRQELLLDKAHGIHVCTVMPAMIDTPILEHAANYTGRAPRPLPLISPPERVARTIVGLAQKPSREAYVGTIAPILALQHTLTPGLTESVLAVVADRCHLARDEPAPRTSGALYTPVAGGTGVSGGWRDNWMGNLHRTATGALAAGMGLVQALALRVRGRKE